jgi:hypothetical protein
MRELKFLILLVVLLAFNSVEARADQITHTVTYDPSKLSITYDTINGNTYARVEYDGLNCFGRVSQPSLPYESLMFYLPYNATNISANIQVNDSILYTLSAPVIPVSSRYNSNNPNNIELSCDTVIYSSNQFFPEYYTEIEGDGFIYGDNHVLVVGIMPFTYNPISRNLKFVNHGTIVINYELSNQTNRPFIARGNNELREKELEELRKKVVNPEMVPLSNDYQLREYGYRPDYYHAMDSAYTYCIITKRHLANSFKKIVALKRQRGISAGVVCLEDLKLDERFNHGDWHESKPYYNRYYINDDAGVIREYLKYAYAASNNSTEYVLLGGDKDNCPIRYGGYIREFMNQINGEKIPTDLYFSNLECDWDIDMDNEYGEISVMKRRYGNMMFFPNLYVGRLLCNSDEQINNYINKNVKYTLNPGKGDYSYLTKGLITQSGDVQYRENSAGKLMNTFTQYCSNFNVTVVQENSGDIPTGADIIDTLNTNFGYTSINGHGSPVGIEVGTDRYSTIHYALIPEDDFYNQYPLLNYEYEDNLNSLNCFDNKEFPNVTYSISCTSMPYDDYHLETYPYYTFNVPCNMGQAFTTNYESGSVAYLGYTRPSFGADSIYNIPTATTLETIFLEYITRMEKIGISEAFSKWDFSASELDNDVCQMKYAHNLLGDPELDMWTSIPQQYSGITVNKYDTYTMISGINQTDIIGYCDNDGNVGKVENVNGLYYISDTTPSTSIMVYSHDHIPYIAPLLLQNCNINNSQYVFASSLSAGRNVSSYMSNGNVTIKNGAVYEIEATDDIHLGEGFVVENGATLAITTPGKVTIDGCVFQCGANVKIEAGKVEVVKSFTAELGSKVEITKFVD